MNNPAFRYLHRSSIGIPVAAMMVAASFMVSPVRSVLGQEYLTVSEAILSNPVVQQQRAQVCQARSRYDQARSSQLPQIETLRRAIDVQKSEESLAKIQLSQIDQERAIIAPLVEAGHEPKLALINLESRYQETLGRAKRQG